MAIVVCGDMETVFDRQLSYLLQDCSACIENLLLCAHVLGFGRLLGGSASERKTQAAGLKSSWRFRRPSFQLRLFRSANRAEARARTRYNPEFVHAESGRENATAER